MTAPPREAPPARTALTVAIALLAAVGIARVGGFLIGFAVLLGVVIACVGALTVGVLLLKSAAGF